MVEMIHAFMLVVVLGSGESRQIQPNSMIFRSIETCNWYASRVVKRYGNYRYDFLQDPKDKATAYCKVIRVYPSKTEVYDH